MRKNYRKKKFNKKRKNTYKIFFLILVGMTVGFAAINTTLQLIGTLNISKTTWNIHWDNPTKTGGVAATTEVKLKDGDNTTVEYQVDLKNPGDYYEFTVDAKNEGTIDGMITGISNKVYENSVEVTKPDYLDFTVTYADDKVIANNHLLAAGKKETYKVKVQYKSGLAADQLPTQTRNLKFTFQVTYMQADENAQKVRPDWTLPTGRTKDNLQTGDEICLTADTSQCFNFIRYDGNDIVMLAKYNLKVGNIYNSSYTKTGEYTQSDTGYGLQSSEARGWVSGNTRNGTVAFSSTSYWDDNGSPKSDYPGSYDPGPNYPTIYDATNYKGAPGENDYSIAYYVDEYKTKLTGYGVTIKDTRLLTYSEAIDSSIGCSVDSYRCPTTGFITNTSFWLGSAVDSGGVWIVSSDGYFSGYDFGSDDSFGVRPVVVISKSNI